MSPQFDPKKNAVNIAKHGVSLATEDGVLHDPLAITMRISPRWTNHVGLPLAPTLSGY
jgi:uncharacterized DUF497 family protein